MDFPALIFLRISVAEGQTVPAENYFKVTLVTKDNVDQIQRPNL